MRNGIDDHLRPSRFAVFRGYDSKPGCVDFLGSVCALSATLAEEIAAKRWPEVRGEYLMVEVDDEPE